nr:diguanylate cyclase [Lachnospiraceae bacterium]
MDKFKRWFGLEKRSEYVNAYFDTANFRSSIYMSVVIIILEVWMIVSLLRRWIGGDPTRSQAWFVEHFISYMIFLLAAACMLIYAVNFLRGRFKDRLPGKIILICFSLVSLSFGINISYSDYCKGEQILCFVMMIIFTVGLINWRPIVSILASST